jgi:sugar phosphate isomerase/epimerase
VKSFADKVVSPMSISDRLGCSTISFRHLALPEALAVIGELGFGEIDLGALPGVCDHVPYVLDRTAVTAVAGQVTATDLRVRSVNGDIGDLNAVLDSVELAERTEHLDRLLDLTAAVNGIALVLPNGALVHEPVVNEASDIARVAAELTRAGERARSRGLQLWVESLHILRLCHTLDRARQLTSRLTDTGVGVVMDFSHVVASGADPAEFIDLFGDRVAHVHLRDASPGNIHHSIGNGAVDFAAGFAALKAVGYDGHFTLELETRDVTHEERPAAAAKAAAYISSLPEPQLSPPGHPIPSTQSRSRLTSSRRTS